jgi:hypothetical protein
MHKRRIWVAVLVLAMTQMSFGVGRTGAKTEAPQSALIVDALHTINANSLEMFVSNIGNFAYDPANVHGKTDGLYYPRGTMKTCIYDAGIWVGAKVGGQTRIAVAEYSSEFCPGPMVSGTYLPDQGAFKVYKIRRGDNSSTSSDWRDWPVNQGAPVDSTGNPMIIGDQMTWAVCNDANPSKHTNNAGSTQPLGVEIQQAAFAFARSGALGNTVYLEFRIINKGNNSLDSAYVSFWVDPDLGDANDDLVGCDTTLSLGYCYNSGQDEVYGATPPAVGISLLQGPMVPGNANSTAVVSGVKYGGYRNLPMGSFNRYVNGIDPVSPSETFNYMKGLNKDGTPVINPTNARVTKFVAPGNPVTGTGWLDSAPSDKRMMLNAGPFTMAPGDTQDIVVAVMVGQGSSAVNSVDVLKQTERYARALYELNFNYSAINTAPSPSVYLRPGNGSVDLIWGSEPVDFVDNSFPTMYRYEFEGFNLYQGESINGPWHKFATYDLDNGVALIYNDVYDPAAGGIQRVIVQSGSDYGLRFDRTLAVSQLDGTPIANDRPYFFAVTAYFYDHLHVTEFLDQQGNLLGWLTDTRESPIVGQEVIPTANPGLVSDTALHVAGSSEGMVIAEYLDVSQLTGHDYEVDFNSDRSWNLRDLTTGIYKLTMQTHQQPDFNFPIVDGMMVRTIGPDPGIGGWLWQGGVRWLTGEEGFGGSYFFGGLFTGTDFWGSNIDPAHDYINVEVRFSKVNTQKAYDYLRGGYPNYRCIGYFDCPFTIWDVSSNPPRQLNAAFVENMAGPTFDSTWFPGVSGISSREYLIFFNSNYSPNADPFYTSKMPNADAYDMDILYVLTPKITPGHDPAVEFQEGQKLTILAAKPNVQGDIFRFHAGPLCGDVDSDGSINIADAVYLIRYIFAGGPAPVFGETADSDCDQRLNIADVVYLINYIFNGGTKPCEGCK